MADICYELAYDVARAAAHAVMAGEGYRASGGSHHRLIFELLRRAEGGRWSDEVEIFDQAGARCRLCVYEENGAITTLEADDLSAVASTFFDEVNEGIAGRGPEEPSGPADEQR